MHKETMLAISSSGSLNKAEKRADDRRKRCDDRNSKIADLENIGFTSLFSASKTFQTSNGQISSNARIRFWGLTEPNGFFSVQTQPSDVAFVNSSGVISTWSRRRPSKDLFTISSDNRHGVSSFDLSDVIPTNYVRRNRIYDFKALIKKDDLWFVHNQTHATCKTDRPSKSRRIGFKIATIKSLKIYTDQHQQQESKTKDAGFASKGFDITAITNFSSHNGIFSHRLGWQNV